LQALKDLFDNYALDFGQVISNGKSTIFLLLSHKTHLIIFVLFLILRLTLFMSSTWVFQFIKENQRLVTCNLLLIKLSLSYLT